MSRFATAQPRSARRRVLTFRRLATLLGAVIVGAAVLVAVLAPYLTPHNPFAQDLNLRLYPTLVDGWQPGRPSAGDGSDRT